MIALPRTAVNAPPFGAGLTAAGLTAAGLTVAGVARGAAATARGAAATARGAAATARGAAGAAVKIKLGCPGVAAGGTA